MFYLACSCCDICYAFFPQPFRMQRRGPYLWDVSQGTCHREGNHPNCGLTIGIGKSSLFVVSRKVWSTDLKGSILHFTVSSVVLFCWHLRSGPLGWISGMTFWVWWHAAVPLEKSHRRHSLCDFSCSVEGHRASYDYIPPLQSGSWTCGKSLEEEMPVLNHNFSGFQKQGQHILLVAVAGQSPCRYPNISGRFKTAVDGRHPKQPPGM